MLAKKNVIFAIITGFLVASSSQALAEVEWNLDLESGYAFAGYNNVQSPNNDTATRFSLTDDLNTEGSVFFRGRFGLTINKRHTLTALYAPLSLDSAGQFDRDVSFEGNTYAQGESVTARYQFNSYRFTYRYAVVLSDRTEFGLGGTVKVRDAVIRLSSASQSAENTDVGVVPLVNLYLKRYFTKNTGFLLEVDALVGPKGRAEDIMAGIFTRVHPNATLKFGYRMVEGGADVDSVYNFAWVHYLAGGVTFNF